MRVVLVELAKTRASVCGVVPRSPSLTWVNPVAPAGRSEGTRATLSAGLPPGLGDAADLVDEIDEAEQADPCVVIDVDAEVALDRRDGGVRAPVGVRLVDLVRP